MASPAGSSFDSLFDEDWRTLGGHELDLDSIAAFTPSFSNDDKFSSGQTSIGSSIDPHFLSSTPSPPMCHGPLTDNSFATSHNGLPQGNMFDFFPPPRTVNSTIHAAGPTPYFHQSLEQPLMLQQPWYLPSPLRNQLHRRSVSEPPGQHQVTRRFQPQSNPTFTRSGTPLGTPKASVITASRSSVRPKQPIYRQPYSVAKRQVPRPERHQLRRTQTQPVHSIHAPTSAPLMDIVLSPPLPPRMSPPIVSSRVCTPAISPQHSIATPVDIDADSMVAGPGLNTKSIRDTIAIPVTIEELKKMIADAVHEAVATTVDSGRVGIAPMVAEEFGTEPQDGKDLETDGMYVFEMNVDDATGFAADEDVRKSIEDDSLFVSE